MIIIQGADAGTLLPLYHYYTRISTLVKTFFVANDYHYQMRMSIILICICAQVRMSIILICICAAVRMRIVCIKVLI